MQLTIRLLWGPLIITDQVRSYGEIRLIRTKMAWMFTCYLVLTHFTLWILQSVKKKCCHFILEHSFWFIVHSLPNHNQSNGESALAITLSHQQYMHIFADGHKDMNDISLIITFAVHPICIQDSIFKMSSASPGEFLPNERMKSKKLKKF